MQTNGEAGPHRSLEQAPPLSRSPKPPLIPSPDVTQLPRSERVGAENVIRLAQLGLFVEPKEAVGRFSCDLFTYLGRTSRHSRWAPHAHRETRSLGVPEAPSVPQS